MIVAFITGGATGIGRATVKKFVAEQMQVGFLDRNIEASNTVITLITANDINLPDSRFKPKLII